MSFHSNLENGNLVAFDVNDDFRRYYPTSPMEEDGVHESGVDLNNNVVSNNQDSDRRDGWGRISMLHSPSEVETMHPEPERTHLSPERQLDSWKQVGKNEIKFEDNEQALKMDVDPVLVSCFSNERASSPRHEESRRVSGVKRSIADVEMDDSDVKDNRNSQEKRCRDGSFDKHKDFQMGKRRKIRLAPPRDDHNKPVAHSVNGHHSRKISFQNRSYDGEGPPYKSFRERSSERESFNQSSRSSPEKAAISCGYLPERRRPIIIDGSNVAYERSHGRYFDSRGIQICVDYFLRRGFTEITVVVPEFRLKKRGCNNPQILRDLKDRKLLITCWSKKMPNGRLVSSYDDRMIVQIAHKRGGIIISNDQYRDLFNEKPDWRYTIEHRVLGFRFMLHDEDEIMFPEDPFGRGGPTLEEMLRY